MKFLVLALGCLWAIPAAALDVPPLQHRVTDLAGLLSPAEARSLENTLAQYEQATDGQQFALLTLPTLQGDPIEDFSIRVVEAWKLGKAKEDTGLLLLIVPQDRKMRIEVGYGLEGKITDDLSSRVIRQVLRPAFRGRQYGAGIQQAFAVLMNAGSDGKAGQDAPQLSPSDVPNEAQGGRGMGLLLLIFVVLLIFGPRFLWPLLFGMSLGGGGRGGGGGGFGGGGGGFGGGGSSGDW